MSNVELPKQDAELFSAGEAVRRPPVPLVVASFRSPSEAESALSALQNAGIEAVLVPQPGSFIGVVAAEEDADRAVEVLDALWPEVPPEKPVIEVERCPECRSTDILRIRRLPFFIVFSTLMFGAGYAAGEFDRAIRDHLVSVHVCLGATACLPNAQREVVIQTPGDHFVARLHDQVCFVVGKFAEILVNECGGFLENAERANHLAWHSIVADIEVVE